MPKIIMIASHKGTCDERDAFCMLIGDDVSYVFILSLCVKLS